MIVAFIILPCLLPFQPNVQGEAGEHIVVAELREILQELRFTHATGQRTEDVSTVRRVPRTQVLP